MLPFSIFAESVNIKCTFDDFAEFNKFNASGVITIDDAHNVSGILNIDTQDKFLLQTSHFFESVSFKGFLKHHNAGELTVKEFDQLVLSSTDSSLKSLNIILGTNLIASSRLLTKDDFSFRSNCKVVE